MSSGANTYEIQERIDKVFHEAVRRNIVLRNMNTFENGNEIDLSGMTLPVARAACRFILRQSLHNKKPISSKNMADKISDLSFITGIGSSHDDGSSSLRDYVQEILVNDFKPPIESYVPQQYRSNRVCIKARDLISWMEEQ
jgi:hypothetical protein